VSAGRNIGGTMNVIMGNDAGRGDTGSDYSYNCIFGHQAGFNLDSGSSNVMLGFKSGYFNEVGSGNVFLGNETGYNETGSDKLYIDNSNTSEPLIYGDFSANTLRFNGNVGIGTAPSSLYGLYIVDDYRSVYGNTDTSTGSYTYGLYGDADGGTTRNISVYGSAASGAGANWSGFFNGDVYIYGTTVKSADQVKIDHPLDPTNKFLYHSNIASDQMTNIYHGNVILGYNGIAEVVLPDWTEEINKDYRYQLTAIGAPGPNLYISKKISNNVFVIAGGSEGMEVSWQVTGIRNDNYAKKNPLVLEKEKNADEKGYYLHPDVYGKSKEMGIENHIQEIEKKLHEREIK